MPAALSHSSFFQQVVQELPTWTFQVEEAVRDAAMASLRDAWQSATQRGQVNELLGWLRARPQALSQAYAAALAERMREELAEPAAPDHQRLPAFLDSVGSLSLMDEHEVETNIEQVRIERQIDQAGEWSLRELRGLCGNLPGRPMHNPSSAYALTPEVCAEAFGRSLKLLHCPGSLQLLALRLAAPVLAATLAQVYERHVQQLRSEGVEAAPLVIRQASGAGLAWGANAASGAAVQPASASWSSGQASAPTTGRTEPQQLAQLLQILARQSHSGPAMAPVWQRLHAPLQRLTPAQLAALQQDDHPFWRLLDRIAGLSAVQSPDDPQMQALADQLAPVLAQLEAPGETLSDANFDSALAELDTLAAPMPGVSPQALESALDHESRRREVEPAVRSQLVAQLRPLLLPPVLKQFLLGPWVQVLSRVLARDGTQAPGTLRAMNLVPDLLAAATQLRRGQFLSAVERQPLLDAAEDGMDAAGLPGHMVQGYLADLAGVLSGTPQAQPPSSPDSPTLVVTPEMLAAARSQDELPAEGAGEDDGPPAGWAETAGEAWSGHAELATVPMALSPDNEAAVAEREAWLQSLKAGDFCRLMLQGRWATALLTWRSDNGQFFMFKSRHAAGSHTLTRRALERLRSEGLATNLQPGQMLARARDALDRR